MSTEREVTAGRGPEDERVDAEVLAAFLEGSASDEERATVLSIVARSQAAHEQLLEASRLVATLKGDYHEPESAAATSFEAHQAGERGVRSIDDRPSYPSAARRRRTFARLLLLASAAAVTGVLLYRGARNASSPDVVRFADATIVSTGRGSGSFTQVFGGDGFAPRWSATRDADDTPLRPTAVSFRGGVRTAQLLLAAGVADSAAVVRSRDQLIAVLRPLGASAPLIATWELSTPMQLVTDASRRAESVRQTRAFLGRTDWFDLGVWTETVHLAVVAGQRDVLAPGGSAVRSLRALIRRSQDEDWHAATAPIAPWVREDHAAADTAAIRKALFDVAVYAGR